MPEEFDKPIPCPKCGEMLETVQVVKTEVLEFTEEEDDGVFAENGQGSTTIICYSCGQPIGHSDGNGAWGIYPRSDDY